MLVAIIGAMEEEIAYLKNKINIIKEEVFLDYHFYYGNYQNKDIVFVKSGVGKVNASMLLSFFYFKYPNVSYVINTGIAGGYNCKHYDVVAAKYSIYSDVDLTLVGYAYGQMSHTPRYFEGSQTLISLLDDNVIVGTICTADKLATDIDEVNNLVKKHFNDLDVKAFDMESAAFAHAAYNLHIPFLSIRTISDVIGEKEQIDSLENNAISAADKNCQVVLSLLNKL